MSYRYFIRSLDLRGLHSKLRHRTRTAESEDKVIPSLEITEEPPTFLDIMEGGSAIISCRAESSNTENIGYSWEYADSNRIIKVCTSRVCSVSDVALVQKKLRVPDVEVLSPGYLALTKLLLQEVPGGVETMDNKLTIRNMTQDQAGWYQCLASDGSNRALSRKTKLNLVCKFSPALLIELLILALYHGSIQILSIRDITYLIMITSLFLPFCQKSESQHL